MNKSQISKLCAAPPHSFSRAAIEQWRNQTASPKSKIAYISLSSIGTILGITLLAGMADAATVSNLVHRWSFGDLTDSIGGSDISLHGAASIDGGSLSLPGSIVPRTNYASVEIGSSIAAANSLTIETWATTTVDQTWSKVWMFGNSTAPLRGMDFSPVRQALTNTLPGVAYSADYSQSYSVIQEPNIQIGPLVPDKQFYVAVVFDDVNDLISLYINGAYAGNTIWNGSVSDLGNTPENYFGAAVAFPDKDYNGSIDEMRIWNMPLTPSEIAANFIAGPDVINVPEPSVFSICLIGMLGLTRRHRRQLNLHSPSLLASPQK